MGQGRERSAWSRFIFMRRTRHKVEGAEDKAIKHVFKIPLKFISVSHKLCINNKFRDFTPSFPHPLNGGPLQQAQCAPFNDIKLDKAKGETRVDATIQFMCVRVACLIGTVYVCLRVCVWSWRQIDKQFTQRAVYLCKLIFVYGCII